MLTADDLRKLGIRSQKGLGQNFLVDSEAVRKVLDAAELSGDETVVEVGPGPGILTPGLCERAKQVIAIELDGSAIPILKEQTAGHDNLEVREADVLKEDPASFPDGYHVVANVPYYITSAIIKHFLQSTNRPAAMTLTIQDEVAERICAGPPKMTVLSVSVQLYGAPTIAGRIKRTAFWPAPDVDSAVLRITDIGAGLEQTLAGLTEKAFFRVVKAGFSGKRKQLHNALAGTLALEPAGVHEALEAAGIDPTRRAETLTIPEWVTLAGKLPA